MAQHRELFEPPNQPSKDLIWTVTQGYIFCVFLLEKNSATYSFNKLLIY